MEPERARAAAVAAHLLANPVLAGLTPLEKEEQALLLLRGRAADLAALLAGPTYLPGLPRDRARGLVLEELRRETDRELGPLLEGLVRRDGGFDFSPALQITPVSAERCREEMSAFLGRLLETERTRAALSAPLAAAHRDLPGRYLSRCFEDRRYVHFELTKVERLRLGPGESASLVRVALLLRAGVFLHAQPGLAGADPRFASEALARLRGELKSLPVAVLRSAVMSHLPFQGNPLLEASARLTAVFAAAARARRTEALRGALPSETSWWSVTRRNAVFHGFDGSMLEEMRGIASRNGW
jgi:hypothetical protein